MMDQLDRIADGLEPGLRGFLTSYVPADLIRGVLLDVDDYWLHVFRLKYSNYSLGYVASPACDVNYWWQQMKLAYDFDIDWHFQPRGWNDRCKLMGYPYGSQPVVIRVILRSDGAKENEGFPSLFENYPIVYEYRPPCRALAAVAATAGWSWGNAAQNRPSSVGCAVPKPTTGTLGGILQSSSPQCHYIVSCAHVLGSVGNSVFSPGPFEDKGLNRIGEVRFSAIPDLKTAGGNCSFETRPTAKAIDVAIAALSTEIFESEVLRCVSRVHHIRPRAEMSKNDIVEFNGKESGCVRGRIGALTIWDEVGFDDGAVAGGARCFGRLFEIKPIKRQYVREDLAKAGDSGAWVTSQCGNLTCWDGVLISSDGGQVYACFAETIMAESRAAFRDQLTPVP